MNRDSNTDLPPSSSGNSNRRSDRLLPSTPLPPLQFNLQKLIIELYINTNVFLYGSAMTRETIDLSLVCWRWFNWVSEWYSTSLLRSISFNSKFAGCEPIQHKLESKYCLFKHINYWRFDVTDLNLLKVTPSMIEESIENIKTRSFNSSNYNNDIITNDDHHNQQQQNNVKKNNNNNNNISLHQSFLNLFKFKSDGNNNNRNTQLIDNNIHNDHNSDKLQFNRPYNITKLTHDPRYFNRIRVEFYKEHCSNSITHLNYIWDQSYMGQITPQQIEEFNALIELSKSSLTEFVMVTESIPTFIIQSVSTNCTNITSLSVSFKDNRLNTPDFLSFIDVLCKGPLETLSIHGKIFTAPPGSNYYNHNQPQQPPQLLQHQQWTDNIIAVLDNDELKRKLKTLWIECLPNEKIASLLTNHYTNLKKFILLPPSLGHLIDIKLLEPFFQHPNLKSISIPLDLGRGGYYEATTKELIASSFPSKIQLSNNITYLSISVFKPHPDILDMVFEPFPSSIQNLRIISYSSLFPEPMSINFLQDLHTSLQEISVVVHMESFDTFLDFFNRCNILSNITISIPEFSNKNNRTPNNFITHFLQEYGDKLTTLFEKRMVSSFAFSLQVPPNIQYNSAPPIIESSKVERELFGYLERSIFQIERTSLTYFKVAFVGNFPKLQIPSDLIDKIQSNYHIVRASNSKGYSYDKSNAIAFYLK